jgi:hypothetical protein
MHGNLAWASWNRIVAVLLAIAVAIPAVINIVIDPYDLFGVSPLGYGPALNQRFQHIRYLTKNPRRFNVLLMGTSIMGINDPRVVDHLVPGARTYNMGFFLATASDLLEAASFLKRQDALPEYVIVGVDTFLFVARDAELRQQFRFPPEVEDRSALNWWLEAAFSSSLPQAANKVFDSFNSLPSVSFNRERGYYSLPTAEDRLLKDPKGHATRAFPPAPDIPTDAHLVPSEFDALAQLVRFFDHSNVRVLWLIQPNSSILRRAYGEPHYQRLMQRVRSELHGDVVDLSDYQNLGDDPMAWFDLKHYTPATGAKVLDAAIRRSSVFSTLSMVPQRSAGL